MQFYTMSAEIALQSTTYLYGALGECNLNGSASVVTGGGIGGETAVAAAAAFSGFGRWLLAYTQLWRELRRPCRRGWVAALASVMARLGPVTIHTAACIPPPGLAT